MPWPTADPNLSLTQDGEVAPSGHLTDTTVHPAATNLEKTANKGAASGYAALDSASKVPAVNLGGAGGSATNFLRGDQTWQVPGGGSGTAKESHIALIALAIGQTF